MYKQPLALILLGVLFLGGCRINFPNLPSFLGGSETNLQTSSQNLATKAMDDYNVGKYFTALEYFEEILNKYPFSSEAILAELKAADCNYYMGHYPEALIQYRTFEERHPTNEAIPYVLFQQGMAHYQGIDRIDRDTSGAEEAIKLFSRLLRSYPQSPYTTEAHARIRAAKEFLANHEFFVAQYYIRTKKLSEATARLKYLLAMYPEAEIAPQATDILARIESDNPPPAGWSAWFKQLSLPDWAKFGKKEKTAAPAKP